SSSTALRPISPTELPVDLTIRLAPPLFTEEVIAPTHQPKDGCLMRPSRVDKNDPKVTVLREVPGLAGLPSRELLSLASLFDEARLEEGAVLTREGDTGRELFLIVDGEALVSLRGDDVATVGPGEFVGEMAMFEQAPRSATVTALTP